MKNEGSTEMNAVHLLEMTLDQITDDTANSSTLTQLRQHPNYQNLVDLGKTTISVLFARLQKRRDHTTLLLLRDLLGVLGEKGPSISENGQLETVVVCDAYIQHGIELGYIQ